MVNGGYGNRSSVVNLRFKNSNTFFLKRTYKNIISYDINIIST